MVSKTKLEVGPVLSFRGSEQKDGALLWKVSALIGVGKGVADPGITLDGSAVAAPRLLLERPGLRLLRYDFTLPLREAERRVTYSIDGMGLSWDFTVPGAEQGIRSAYVSCNGFSDPRAMRKLVHKAGAVWQDLVTNHDRRLHPDAQVDKEQLWHLGLGHGTDVQRFHLLVMGGDQIYFDSIWEDNEELKEWADLDRDAQIKHAVKPRLEQAISDYYFTKYCERWLRPSRGGWAKATQERDSADAMARIPTVMMWDDHDIFDGWGSYTQQMQNCAVAQTLFKYARQAFWVYQMQQPLDLLPALEEKHAAYRSIDAPGFKPVQWSQQLKTDPLALPLLDGQPGFSSAFKLGTFTLLALDLRTERSRKQILSECTWEAVEKWLAGLQRCTKADTAAASHLLVLSSVPVAHPKLSMAEALLDTFGSEHVVESNADDLKDHWSHDDHEPERKRLTRLLMKTALDKRIRAVIVSGDVHVAAWGSLYRKDATSETNWLRIQQLTSSAVLHPAPSGPIEGLFVKLLNTVAAKAQPIDTEHEVEMMLFPAHGKYFMAARNWLALEPDPGSSAPPRLWATWRCEAAEGFSNHLLAIHPAIRED